jgi:hypothetical protein
VNTGSLKGFMLMRQSLRTVLLALTVVVAGCATPPQLPIKWTPQAAKAATGRVAVVMSALPKPDTQFPGASCLLCLAVASGANSDLTKQVQTYSNDDLLSLKDEVATLLKKQGIDAYPVLAPQNLADLPNRSSAPEGEVRRDLSSIRQALKADRLLVIDLPVVAVHRPYASYISTGGPFAVITGQAYLVDLATNKLAWNEPINLTQTAEGKWDEPPKFPGVTNAFYQVIEKVKDQVKRSLQLAATP